MTQEQLKTFLKVIDKYPSWDRNEIKALILILAAVLSFKEIQAEQLAAILEEERSFLRCYPNCDLCGYNDEKEFLQGELHTLKQWIELFNLTFKGLI